MLRIPGTDKLIACADRWMPQWWVPKMTKQILAGMERHFKDYIPNREALEDCPLPGVEQKHSENTWKSNYVWLPIEWEGENLYCAGGMSGAFECFRRKKQ